MTDHCRSCNAPIELVQTPAGKPMPLDAEPSAKGNVFVGADGLAHVVAPGAGNRVSHFASCPSAKEWRKPRG